MKTFLKSNLYDEMTETSSGAGGVATTTPDTTTPATSDVFGAEPVTQTQTQTATQQTDTTVSGATQQTKPVAATATLSADEIASIAAKAAQQVVPAPQQTQQTQQQPQLTQEEFDKTFNVYKPTAEDFAAIMGYAPEKPEQLVAFGKFTQNIVRQATTMAQYIAQQQVAQLKQEFDGRFEPVARSYADQQANQLKTQFFEAHPDLKDNEALVMEIATNLKHSGKQFKTPQEAFQFVAEKTRSLLPKGAATTQTHQQPVQRTMTSTSVGGQHNGGSTATQPQSDARFIFS